MLIMGSSLPWVSRSPSVEAPLSASADMKLILGPNGRDRSRGPNMSFRCYMYVPANISGLHQLITPEPCFGNNEDLDMPFLP